MCIQILATPSVGYSLLPVGTSIWCGAEKDIIIWDGYKYVQLRRLSNRQTDPVISLIIVWDRIIWSASLDKSICVWS